MNSQSLLRTSFRYPQSTQKQVDQKV